MPSTTSHINMTEGGLFRKLLLFSLPLLLSGVMQQSFNSVDIAVVGRWAGREALAAVGNNGVVISLIVNLFVGISIGANVVIANYIGAKDAEGIRKSIRTSAVVALWSGVALLLLTLAVARPLLQWVDTPPEVIDHAVLYLRIFALGMPFMMVYNFGSAILRSLGDTRRPFYALVAAGILNIALNLVFVINFGMGVAGVAIATVLSNVLAAVLVVVFLVNEPEPYRLHLRRAFKTDIRDLKEILRIGLPAGIQSMVFSISNVFILGAINRFGADAAAGSSVALNYEYYCYYVISAFAQAAVAFVSQNYGAGKYERCRKVFRLTMAMSLVSCGALNIFIALESGIFAEVFTQDPEVIRYAGIRMHHVLMFQFLASSYEIAAACMRGYGYSTTPAILTIFGTCVVRLAWVWWLTRYGGTFPQLMDIYPITWVITGVLVLTAYFLTARRALHRA